MNSFNCIFYSFPLLFFWGFVCSQNQSTLRQLFVVYRHGDRAPISLFPTDTNPSSDWPDGLGELTIIGKQEHYALGKYLRNMYRDFLTDNVREMLLRSSNVNRCLDSAQCNAAGLYPPVGRQKWNNDLDWQPIPLHTTPEAEDMLLTTDPVCPEYTKEIERIKQSPEGSKFLEEHKTLFEIMSNNSGSVVTGWQDASYVFDTMFIEKRYNLSIPEWALPIWSNMSDVDDLSFYFPFSTQISKRLRGGFLLGDITSKMEKKVGDKPGVQKLYVYSTHDTIVAALLSAIGVFNMRAPPYCATIIFELHEIGRHDHVVRLFYRNTTDPASQDKPILLTVPGCEEDCPLGHFVRLTQDNIPIDWREECGIQEPTKPYSTTAFVIFGTMGLVLLLLLLSTSAMLWLRCQKEKTGVRYQRVPEDINS